MPDGARTRDRRDVRHHRPDRSPPSIAAFPQGPRVRARSALHDGPLTIRSMGMLIRLLLTKLLPARLGWVVAAYVMARALASRQEPRDRVARARPTGPGFDRPH
jgi:hypothetical protein